MTNKELQAARKLLFLDASEAAEYIGCVSVRSWQYWESGRSPVPVDVSEKIKTLAQRRLQFIEDVEDVMNESDTDDVVIDYYQTFVEYKADHHLATVIDWRMSQSVAAYFFLEGMGGLR
jgi:Lon protease-like protein